MSDRFKAFRIYAQEKFERAAIETLQLDDLSAGDVLIKVHYSSVNYKDALAGSGQGKILRKSPLNGGIDCAGVVVDSSVDAITAGQQVLVNGCGLSEVHDGGYSEYVRVPADWVITVPVGLDMRNAMLIGTAGFTAALAIQRLLDNHQTPEQGPICVTGASGGVGSFAIRLLSQLGFDVVAMTRKANSHAYLQSLGASQIIRPDELRDDNAPMHKGRWAGAIDNLGGHALATLIKSIKPWGNIVSVGMAAGAEVQTSTMPFILRGMSVLGVSSANCPQQLRRQIWSQLGDTWQPNNMETILAGEISLEELPQTFEKLLTANTQGRYLVKID
jgi:NADPH2:quinone reductase